MAKEKLQYVLLKINREHLPILEQLVVHAVERSEYPISTVINLVELYKIIEKAKDNFQ